MQPLRASARHGRAIRATADLLTRLKLEFVFVGEVARSLWLGTAIDRGSVDVLALLSPEQKNMVAMMGSNRGFRVERDEIEQSEELDLVPLNFVDPEGDVRVHVLVASNALYGRMVAAGRRDGEVAVAAAEDLALLLAMGEDRDSMKLVALPGFDRAAYNRRLIAIGLPELVVAE